MNLHSEEYLAPQHQPLATESSSTAYLLQLSCQLQSSLELNTMMEILFNSLHQRFLVSGLIFTTHGKSGTSVSHSVTTLELGVMTRHVCHYDVQTCNSQNEHQVLGGLTLSRRTRFIESELQALESVIALLVYPLRNALQYQALQSHSRTDALTGVSNRRHLDETLERELKLARRQGSRLSLLLIDVDHFKQINDHHGHQIGDEALKSICHSMQQVLRETDRIYRYGGDEFVILLDNTDEARARLVGERLRISVEKIREKSDWLPALSITVGTATLLSVDCHETLFARADTALYRAKQRGRNCVETTLPPCFASSH